MGDFSYLVTLTFFSENHVSTHFWSKFNNLFTSRPSPLIRSFLSFFPSYFPKRNFPYTVWAELYFCFGRPTFKGLPYLFNSWQTFFQDKQFNTSLFSWPCFFLFTFLIWNTVWSKMDTKPKWKSSSVLFLPGVILWIWNFFKSPRKKIYHNVKSVRRDNFSCLCSITCCICQQVTIVIQDYSIMF